MWQLDLLDRFDKQKIIYAVAGGFAVSLHGVVRGTVDLDLSIALDLKNLIMMEGILLEIGFQSRIPVTAKDIFHFRKEYIEKRNLIAWSFAHRSDPGRVVDLLILNPIKKTDRVLMSIGGQKIYVLSKNALIRMKEAAGRPQDLEDVRALRSKK